MSAQNEHGLNRRGFLQRGAAAIGGLAGVPTMVTALEKNADPFGGFTMGVQSYCFRNFDREAALKRTQELGLHFIEFYQKHAPPDSDPDQIKAILRLCADYDIKPIAYGVQGFTNNHDAN